MERATATTIFASPSAAGASWQTVSVSPLRHLRRQAWALSCALSTAVHAVALAIALSVFSQPAAKPPPTIRLVFLEPPPPAPLPVAGPEGSAEASLPRRAASVPERAERPLETQLKKPRRLVLAKGVEARRPRTTTDSLPAPETQSQVPVGSEKKTVDRVGLAEIDGVAGGIPGGVTGGRGAEAVPANQVARPPVVTKRVLPVYPLNARRQGIVGLVRVAAVLDSAGQIEEPVRVLDSVPALDAAAIAAFRQWQFTPARDPTGRSVRVVIEVPIRFVLDEPRPRR